MNISYCFLIMLIIWKPTNEISSNFTADEIIARKYKESIGNLDTKIEQIRKGLKPVDNFLNSAIAHECKYCKQHEQNGGLLWKINKFSAVVQHLNKTSTGIFSRAFATSTYGYNLRASFHVEHNPKANATFLSINVHIIQGEFDAILKWPFRGFIVLNLLNQCDDKRRQKANHVITISNTKASKHVDELCFKMPRAVPNVGVGLRYFISLTNLNKCYLKKDAVYLKIDMKPI